MRDMAIGFGTMFVLSIAMIVGIAMLVHLCVSLNIQAPKLTANMVAGMVLGTVTAGCFLILVCDKYL
jgi:hypothetical protein